MTLWDTDDGRAVASRDEGSTEAFRFSPDGRRLALLVAKQVDARSDDSGGGTSRSEVVLWDAHDGSQVTTIALPMGLGQVETLFEFSPDGARLATSSRENAITVWSVADETATAHLTEADGIVTAIGFSPDGSRIAGGTRNGVVSLWDPETGRLLGTRIGHKSAVTALAFQPDGLTIASGSRDGTIRIWDAVDGRPRAEFPPSRVPAHRNKGPDSSLTIPPSRSAEGGQRRIEDARPAAPPGPPSVHQMAHR